MKVGPSALPGVLIVEPDRFPDGRGYFQEAWHQRRYAEAGIEGPFVQDNISFSGRGVLRGLHLQNPKAQGKLVSVLMGEVFDVAVDLRVGSPHFGRWAAVTLSAENAKQLWVPRGFGHGFCVLGDRALIAYKCTDFYDRASELTVRWNDPRIAIAWPIENPSVSDRDAAAPFLSALDASRLPVFGARG